MLISYPWLLAIVLGSMFIGCCVGVVMMAMCKVSALPMEDDQPWER